MLWFDVEERYNTTEYSDFRAQNQLWFDVEERYNTTTPPANIATCKLWFDVEERYNTTLDSNAELGNCCGLM